MLSYLHADQGMAVLRAGRHLFCEKPLAMSTVEATALADAAQAHNALLTVDYVMRQNALWRLAADLRQSAVLGDLLHMHLANHAAGKSLPADHWFWDETKSGGIWIEHGVHFFDAFAWVAGTSGKVIASHQLGKQRVSCIAQYGSAMAHFYHGFTHSGHTEQTTVTLTFEHAHITLCEWVPTVMSIVTDVAPSRFEHLLPQQHTVTETAPQRWQLNVTLGDKSAVYERCIQDGLLNLVDAIHGKTPLHVTASDALASLHMAEAATRAGA